MLSIRARPLILGLLASLAGACGSDAPPTLAVPGANVGALIADHSYVYAAAGDQVLRLDPLTGEQTVFATAAGRIVDLHSDGTTVFFLTADHIYSLAVEGANAPSSALLIAAVNAVATHFIADATTLYISVDSPGLDGLGNPTTNQLLYFMPKSAVGQDVTFPSLVVHAIGAMAVNDQTALVGGDDLFTVRPDTGSALLATAQNVTAVAAGPNVAFYIADPDNTLYRVAFAKPDMVTKLVAIGEVGSRHWLAVDDHGGVYWNDAAGIETIAASSGARTTLVSATAASYLTAAPAALYFVDGNEVRAVDFAE